MHSVLIFAHPFRVHVINIYEYELVGVILSEDGGHENRPRWFPLVKQMFRAAVYLLLCAMQIDQCLHMNKKNKI